MKCHILISTKPPKEYLEDGNKNEEKHPEEEPSWDEIDNVDMENDEKVISNCQLCFL